MREIVVLVFGHVDVADAVGAESSGQLAAQLLEGGGDLKVEDVGVDGQKAKASVNGGESHLAPALVAAAAGRTGGIDGAGGCLGVGTINNSTVEATGPGDAPPAAATVVAGIDRHDEMMSVVMARDVRARTENK